MAVLIILATIMAIFAVIGYISGSRAAFVTTLVILGGLLLISRAGGTIARLINGMYFGIRFVLAGGLQALAASADRSAAISGVIQRMGPVPPLIPSDAAGAEFVLILVILVLLSFLIGRSARLGLRGPASVAGLLWGLVSGYLVGAYLLVSLLPSQAAMLPLPFGLNRQVAAAEGVAVAAPPPAGGNFVTQLVASVRAANMNTLAFIVMSIIAIIVLAAAYLSTRGSARSGRNGTR